MTAFDETPEHGWRVHRLLECRAAAQPDFPFLHFDGQDYSHAEINRRANRMAEGLIARGLEPGMRVAVMMKSAPEYIDVWFALAKAGAVEVPLNTAYKGDLLEHILKSSDSSALVVEEDWLTKGQPSFSNGTFSNNKRPRFIRLDSDCSIASRTEIFQ